jgi:hypothetical protein
MRDFLPDSVNCIPLRKGRVTEDFADETAVAVKAGSGETRKPG